MYLSLALQGGGAHGAFTWGVLDRLLDEDDIVFDRISGTSAGALNGAALASGWAHGGRAGARRNLALLWRKVAEAGAVMTFLHVPLKKPGLGVWDDAMPLLSPYQTNPLALEPLRYILASVVDVEALRSPTAPQLFVNAVNVHTGHSRVFGPRDLSIAALMASACAPLMFQAVPIDGATYWDGSYGGNPMLWPLYEDRDAADILLVELTPLYRPETPTTAKNILNRINELASIAGLVAEMRTIDALNRLGVRNGIAADRGGVRLHVVSLPEVAAEVEPSSKRTIDMLLFESLRREGHAACDEWLRHHKADVGRRSSLDIRARYLAPHEQDAAPTATAAVR